MTHPTLFQVSAALWVIRAVDVGGTDATALDRAFQNAVTLGRFPRVDLDGAYSLLVERGLLVTVEGRTNHHDMLTELLALPDTAALPLLTRLLIASPDVEGEVDDAVRREMIGALGEETVIAWCVDELRALGHHDLAIQVRRVSLISDRFGYDISAPSIGAELRMLEAKTSTSASNKTFRFYLTRNEYEVGRRNPRQWAMVACASDGETATLLGWCRASELERYLPDDGNGHWIEALVNLPIRALLPGAPSALP